jgi:general secretion pathway protein B
MSFILDALKKSETDRQRQNGPALFEVKVPPPRSGLPMWALAIVILLGINMVVVAWMLLRHPAQAPATTGQTNVPAYGQQQAGPYGQPGNPMATASSYAQAGQQPQGMPLPGSVPMGGPGQMQQGQMQQGQTMGQMPANGQPGMMQPGMTQPGMYPGATSQGQMGQNGMNQGQPFNRDGGAAMDSTNNAGDNESNPDDYAPATEQGSAFSGRVKRGTEVGVPLYPDADTAQASGMPQLRLDFHVFATKQQDRFVMINMHRLREGDTTPEGVHLESITPDGVIVSRNGSKYYLPKP